MKRRDFLDALGGVVVLPLTARAQQGERVRRIGLILPASADDPPNQARVGAFLQGLGLGRLAVRAGFESTIRNKPKQVAIAHH